MTSIIDLFFDPRGKLGRAKYFHSVITSYLILVIFSIAFVFIHKTDMNLLFVILFIAAIAIFLYTIITLSIKRLRDANSSPWWATTYLLAGLIIPMTLFLSIYKGSTRKHGDSAILKYLVSIFILVAVLFVFGKN